MIGTARILEFVKDKTVDALCPPLILLSKSCSSNGKCRANRCQATLIKTLPVWATGESTSFGIFRSHAMPVTEKLCSPCRTQVKELVESVRQEFWSLLPTFFGLPDWLELMA
jgi:hypothetical protein